MDDEGETLLILGNGVIGQGQLCPPPPPPCEGMPCFFVYFCLLFLKILRFNDLDAVNCQKVQHCTEMKIIPCDMFCHSVPDQLSIDCRSIDLKEGN